MIDVSKEDPRKVKVDHNDFYETVTLEDLYRRLENTETTIDGQAYTLTQMQVLLAKLLRHLSAGDTTQETTTDLIGEIKGFLGPNVKA
jgi:hypothetical protein